MEGDGWGKSYRSREKRNGRGSARAKVELELSSGFGKQPRGHWDGEGRRKDEEEAGKEAAGPESLRELGALQGPSEGGVCLTQLFWPWGH